MRKASILTKNGSDGEKAFQFSLEGLTHEMDDTDRKVIALQAMIDVSEDRSPENLARLSGRAAREMAPSILGFFSKDEERRQLSFWRDFFEREKALCIDASILPSADLSRVAEEDLVSGLKQLPDEYVKILGKNHPLASFTNDVFTRLAISLAEACASNKDCPARMQILELAEKWRRDLGLQKGAK